MKKLVAVMIAAAVCFASADAYAAQPSKSSLSAMGLSGMQPISDVEGSKVRGMGGYVYVTGFASSLSFWGGYQQVAASTVVSGSHGVFVQASIGAGGAGASITAFAH